MFSLALVIGGVPSKTNLRSGSLEKSSTRKGLSMGRTALKINCHDVISAEVYEQRSDIVSVCGMCNNSFGANNC